MEAGLTGALGMANDAVGEAHDSSSSVGGKDRAPTRVLSRDHWGGEVFLDFEWWML